MKLRLYRTFLIVCIALVLGFILYNSTRTATQSSSISQGVSDVIVETVIPDFSQMDKTEQEQMSHKTHKTIRNVAHAVEFAGLAFFLSLLLFTYRFNYGRYLIATAVTLTACFVFALLDEMLQGLFKGRGTDIMDVGMDMLGVAVAVIGTVIVDKVGLKIFVKPKENQWIYGE